MKNDLLQQLAAPAKAVLALDRYFGPRVRFWTSKMFAAIFIFFVLATAAVWASAYALPSALLLPLAVVLSFLARLPGINLAHTAVTYAPLLLGARFRLASALGAWNGVMLFALAGYVVVKMLNLYARSAYYESAARSERELAPVPHFVARRICASAKLGDLLRAFVIDELGFATMIRAGFTFAQLQELLGNRSDIKDYRDDERLLHVCSLPELAGIIADDPALLSFCTLHALHASDIVPAAEWIERRAMVADSFDRYWGKVAFSRLTALGEDLAYGQGFKLRRYAGRIDVPPSEFGRHYGGPDVIRLEEALTRDEGRNALLVAPAPHVAEEVVLHFAQDIVYSEAHKALRHKHCYLFDVQYYCKDMEAPTDFERGLDEVLRDAARAGNVIFVISDMPALYVRARQLGADVAGVLRPYLANESLQIIAISDTTQYHELLAPQELLSEHFHDIHLAAPEEMDILPLLLPIADRMEAEHGVRFTIPALREIVRDAERTLVHGLLVDRAEEIIKGIPAHRGPKNDDYVLAEDVDAYVSENVRMPIGKVSEDEAGKLLDLEQLLHESVVGQEVAITSIAGALRRARAGVRNEKKPVASFLFFGPTGVGKTESAKTLARVFFGGEEKMLRFDMSEFADRSGLAKLIGTIDGAPGALPPILRDHPYGVLLLDEFEKADPAVHDLFLQVLDEGLFHDGQGRPVNCRNLIVIATSNVGAAEIHAHMKHGGEFDEHFAHDIVDEIVTGGEFRPELLNRFDGLVLFSPIDEDGYRKIATLMLTKLAKRLREKGIVLVINEPLIAAVMEKGVDPVFGARPMQRAVQDIVEKSVAEKILRGKAGPGVPVEFTAQELGV